MLSWARGMGVRVGDRVGSWVVAVARVGIGLGRVIAVAFCTFAALCVCTGTVMTGFARAAWLIVEGLFERIKNAKTATIQTIKTPSASNNRGRR